MRVPFPLRPRGSALAPTRRRTALPAAALVRLAAVAAGILFSGIPALAAQSTTKVADSYLLDLRDGGLAPPTAGTHGKEEEGITFIHIADTHYNTRGEDFEGQRARLQKLIDLMNAIPGTPYAEEVGGVVGTPMGVFISGDLTEAQQADFDRLVEDWGLAGGDGLLDFPVYEGAGNHDGPPSTAPGGVVRRSIIERNPHRPHLASISENGLHYSLDYQGVHFVQLNEYAGLDGHERYPGNPVYDRKAQGYGNPAEESLQFLVKTLEEHVGDSGRPVILNQHYGVDGWSVNAWGDEQAWWTDEHVMRLWEAIEDYNVIAMLVGHDHSHKVMQWLGITVYHMDAVLGFGVYRIQNGELVRIVRNVETDTWGEVHRQSTSIHAGMPPELVQGPYLVYDGNPSEMTVLWRTMEKVEVELAWGHNEAGWSQNAFQYVMGEIRVEPYDEEKMLYRATLTDLKPDTPTIYRLKIGDKYAPGMFYTAPAEDADRVKFLIYGSTAAGSSEHARISRVLYDKIYEDPGYHTVLIHAGDWAPQVDRIQDWDEYFFSRDREARHARYMQSRMPLMGAPGRREAESEVFGKLFPYASADSNYHSFRYGPVHIAVIDAYSDYSENSEQYAWLAQDLEQAEAPWKILVFNGPHFEAEAEEIRRLLQSLCEKYGVNLVIDGGSRGYERSTVGAMEYIGLGAARREETSATLYFGAVQIEDQTLTLKIFEDTGEEVDILRFTLP